MSLTLKQIRYFIAAAEIRQISLAAVEMNISQSAVTAAVQNLEAELGVQLLERSYGGVRPTLEGARFLARARHILATVEDAIRSPLSDERPVEGVLRLGTTYTVTGYFLPRYYVRFQRAHPGIRIDLQELPRRTLEAAVAEGEVDIALMLVSNLERREELDGEALFRSRRRLWLPPQHPLAEAGAISLADVGRHPYIMLTVDEAAQTQNRYWNDAGVTPQVVFTTSSVEAVRSMVGAGAGVAILSDMVFRPWSLDGQRIEQRDLSDPVPSMDVGLAWRRDTPLSGPAALFRQFLRTAVGSDTGA